MFDDQVAWLATQTSITLLVRIVGFLGVRRLADFALALRGGLAAMFIMTGVSHFTGMRDELVEMVPAFVPAPEFAVSVTGVLEILGAVGLLWSRTASLAALGLTLLLLAMFPANVQLALVGADLPWWQQLVPRTLIQILFLAASVTSFVQLMRARRWPPSPSRNRAPDRRHSTQ